MDIQNFLLLGGSFGALMIGLLSSFKSTLVSAVQAVNDIPDKLDEPSGTSKLDFTVDSSSADNAEFGLDLPNQVSGRMLVVELRYAYMSLSRISEFAYRLVINDKLHEFKYTVDSGFIDSDGRLTHSFSLNLSTLFVYNISAECVITYDNNFTKLLSIQISPPSTKILDKISANDLEQMKSWDDMIAYPSFANLLCDPQKSSYFDSDVLVGAKALLVPTKYTPDKFDVPNLEFGVTKDISQLTQRSGLLVSYLKTMNGWKPYNLAKPPVRSKSESTSLYTTDLSYMSSLNDFPLVQDVSKITRGEIRTWDLIGKTVSILPVCTKTELDYLVETVDILMAISVFSRTMLQRRSNWDGLFNITQFMDMNGKFRNDDFSRLEYLLPNRKGDLVTRLRLMSTMIKSIKTRSFNKEISNRTKTVISNTKLVECDPQWLSTSSLFGPQPRDSVNDLYISCKWNQITKQLMLDYSKISHDSSMYTSHSMFTLILDARINPGLINLIKFGSPAFQTVDSWELPSIRHWKVDFPEIVFFRKSPGTQSFIMTGNENSVSGSDHIPVSIRSIYVNSDFVSSTVKDDGDYPLHKSPSWRYTLDTCLGKILFNHVDLGIDAVYDSYLTESIDTLSKVSNLIEKLRVDLFNNPSNLRDVSDSLDYILSGENKIVIPFDESEKDGNILLFRYSSLDDMMTRIKGNLSNVNV